MEKTRKWRKILAMMLTVVMMLQNAQSVMVFADVTNEQIEQRLAGNQGQTEETQPAQSQVDTRANGEEYKTQSQETQENGNGSTDIGSPESGNATTEAKTSNADVSATITQSVFQADVSGTTCNFVQMTAQITNNDTENPATGVSVKALLNSAQLNYVNGYGTETTGAGAYVVDSNNTADLPSGSADGYNQIVMWTDQTIGAGETVAYQFAAQIIPENLDGVVNAWYVDGTSCSYTWENTEILVPTQAPVEPTPEVVPPQTEPEEKPEVKPEETTPEVTEAPEVTPAPEVTEVPEATPTPEVTEVPEATPTPEVTEVPEATPTPEPTQAAEDKKAIVAKKKEQKRLLNQKARAKAFKSDTEDTTDIEDSEGKQPATANENVEIPAILQGMTLCGNGKEIKTEYIKGSTLKVDGKEVTDWSNITINRDSKVELSISYEYPESPAGEKPTLEDNIRYYNLPNNTNWDYLQIEGYIHDKNGRQAGRYEIKNNKIYLYYDNRLKGVNGAKEEGFLKKYPDNIKGTFTLTMEVNKQSTADKNKIDLKFPGTATGNVTINDSDVTGTKTLKTDEKGNPIFDEDGNLEYTITIDPVKQNTNNIIITDELSKNLEFVNGSFKISKDGGKNYTDINATINGTQATIAVGNLNYNEGCIIKYKVKPSGDIETTDISNTASWTWDGAGEGDHSSTIKNNIKNEILSKTGSDEGDNTILYRIEINKLKATLIPENSSVKSIKLSDNLNPQVLTYLYDARVVDEKGNSISGVSILYDAKTGDLTVDGIPDKTYAILTYSVQVKTNPGEKGTKDIVNEVKMTGSIPVDDSTTTPVQIVEHSATVEGTSGTITINKKGFYPDKTEQTQLPLEGIEFTLYEVDLTKEKVDLEGTPYLVRETDSNGEIEFGSDPAQRVKLNTLYYYKETKAPNYIIDPTKYYFVLAADDNTKNLINTKCSSIASSVNYYEDGVVIKDPIFNKKIPYPTSANLIAQKNKDGDAAAGYTFSMELKGYEAVSGGYSPADDNNAEVEYTIPDSTSDDNGKISFNNIIFKYEGIYTFVIREKNGSDNDTIYDNTEYKVIYTVGRDGFGDLTVTNKTVMKGSTEVYKGNDAPENCNIIFNNHTAVRLTLKKEINIADTKDRTFNFTINSTDKTFNFEGVKLNGKQVSVKNNIAEVSITVPAGTTSQTIELTGIPKGKELVVKEKTGNMPDGWSYASTNPENGTVTMDQNKTVTVTNKYEEKGSITFKVSKIFNDWRDGQSFQFTIKALGENTPAPNNPTVNVTNDSSVGEDEDIRTETFGEVSYTENGDYYYLIEEVKPDSGKEKGITYDQKVTYIKVKVTDGVDGKKTVQLFTSGKTDKVKNDSYKTFTTKFVEGLKVSAEFENKYKASTSVQFKGTKTIAGRDIKNTDVFTFEVSGGNLKTPVTVNNDGADINFAPITFTQDDLKGESSKEFTFKIRETGTPSKGITFDSDIYEVKVVVTKNDDGTLSAAVKDAGKPENGIYILPNKNGKTATFVNTYGASTRVILTATKTIDNRSLKDKEFTFKISGDGLGENGKEVKNAADGTIEFPIDYTLASLGDEKEKTFTYTVEEVDGNSKNGVTYDKTKYTVKVKVSDNGSGELKAEVIEGAKKTEDNKYAISLPTGTDKKANFENTYDAQTTIQFTGRKVLNNKALNEDEFEFQISGFNIGEGAPVKVKNDKDGNIEFPEITYKLTDLLKNGDDYGSNNFVYEIKEVDPKQPGITYDDTKYTVTVMVTNNNTGTLTTTVKMGTKVLEPNSNTDNKIYSLTGDKATFTNEYGAKETSVSFAGIKELQNRALKGEDFTFSISGIDGTVYSSEIKNDKDGNIKFNPITYKLSDLDKDNDGNYTKKVFNYVISEKSDIANPGVTYSDKVYYAKVTVTNEKGELVKKVEIGTKDVEGNINYSEVKENSDGNYLITPEGTAITGKQLSESGEEAKAIVFTNRYEAAGSITLTGKKVVEGTDKLKAGEFKFEVKEGVGENAKVVATGTNDENGNITFSEISYAYNSKNNDLGEHVYTVTEVQPKDGDGYVYDLTSRKIVVKVTDNQDKTLKAEIIAASEKDAELKSDVTNNVINSFINKQISITIRKNDANKARLADAELALFEYDNEKKAKTGDAIDTWTTSKDNDHTITGKLVAGKTYILEETKAPDGYAEANPIIFTIKNDGVRTIEVVSGGQLDETGKVLIMVDQKTGVQILKVDEKGKGVPGAELAIFDGDKQIGASWTTDGQAHVIEGLTAGKTYTLKELKAPSGYKKAEDKTFTIDASKVVEVRMEDKTIKLSIMKIDENGQGLKGADLEIRNKNNELIDKWTSETTEHVVDEEKSRKLVEGEEYTLIETKAPEGYALANPKTFTIKSSETVTKVTMENVPNSVIISKKSLTGIESIGGAKLRVLDPQGNEVVKTWTTEKGKDKAVTGVFKPNVTYTLEEVEAPEGYRKAANIMFSLNETGELYVGNTKVTSVVMRDALTKASILKVDESGKGIAGADLVIKDSKGNIKATWTSDGTPHAVEGVLKVGETYTLSETKAPSGYTVAPDQTFKMEDKDVVEVTMVDYPASGSGQITVTKKVTFANGGDSLDLIAQDDTFYVNLFTDAAGKYPYKGAKPQAIHLVNASAGSVTFSDLAQGTYYVYETDANGNVINLDQEAFHNGTQFMCTVNGGSNTVKLDLKAGPKEGVVNLENVFYDIPTGYSYKAEININKQVLKGTSQTTVDDTFYAGIFTKDDQGVYNLFTVVPLVQNDTVTVEVPLGGEDGTEPINYYILETDADGNILDLDVFEYEVTGEGTVALSKDNLAGNINLVNKIPEDTDGKLRVQKTDGNGVGLAGASFRLTDEDGSVIDEWTSEASAHELELEPGTYTLTEVQAPTGYTGAGSVTIKVDDDYNFSVSGEIDYSYKGGLLKIVNKATTSTPSSGTPVSGGSTPASYSSALSGKVAVKTGDNTPIGAYAAVLVIAALAIAGGIFVSA